ncbi:radical SAM protein [Candidatus Cloacimonadota bacterium]
MSAFNKDLFLTADKVRKNLRNIIRKRPSFLLAEILLTYNCTQHCLQCNIPERAGDDNVISVNNCLDLLDRLARYGTQGIVLSGGEVTSHKDYGKIIEYAASKKFIYRHVLSNLYFSEPKMADFISLILENRFNLTTSFDGMNEIADKIRGGKNVASIVKNNMEFLDEENTRLGRPIRTTANIVLSQLNLYQVPEMISYLNELGWLINVDIYRNSSINHNQVDEMVITDFELLAEILRYLKNVKDLITPQWLLDGYVNYLKNDFEKACPYLHNPGLGSKFFIQPNGDVIVCIGDPIGNLFKQTPDEIFDSEAWQKKIREFELCPGCWNTCYTPVARMSKYFDWKESRKILKLVKD